MKKIIVSILLLFSAVSAVYGQDYKSFKDKDTKLFGYKVKSSGDWVIEPQFDKARNFSNGVAEVEVDGGTGVIDVNGEFILEPVFRNVHFNYKKELIDAQAFIPLPEPNIYNDGGVQAWGVYTFAGDEIFAPQFSSRISFGNNGMASAADAVSGWYGIVCESGEVGVPFENWYASSSGSGFKVLDRALVWQELDKSFHPLRNVSVSAPMDFVDPYSEPYATLGDDFRAAAYGHLEIGAKHLANRVWSVTLDEQKSSRVTVRTSPLQNVVTGGRVDWGDGRRFVRLEPVAEDGPRTGSIFVPETDTYYTIQANLYDPDGELLVTLSDWGYIRSQTDQGVIYCAEDEMFYFISSDVNWPNEAGSFTLTGFRAVDNTSAISAFGLAARRWDSILHSWTTARSLHRDVEKAELAGLSTYAPRPELTMAQRRVRRDIERQYSVLNQKFYSDMVIQAKPGRVKDGFTEVLTDGPLRFSYVEDYSPASLKIEATEDVFWGIDGDRYIGIEIEPFEMKVKDGQEIKPGDIPGLVDNISDSGYAVRLVFCLYENDGTFVRTLGSSAGVGFVDEDVIFLEDMGWLFCRHPERYRLHGWAFPPECRLEGVLSKLDIVNPRRF